MVRLFFVKLGGFVLFFVDLVGEEDFGYEDYEENDFMEKSGVMMCLYLYK